MKRSAAARECPVPVLDWEGLGRVDFADAFSARLSRTVDARDGARAFVDGAPWWIKALMVVRNVIVWPLRLKREHTGAPSRVEAGATFGPFLVVRASPAEVFVAADDRHLDARLVILSAEATLTAVTAVSFNGRLGRVYFAVVKPFHRRVVPALLRAAARSLER
jgi:hypothetical protein